MLTGQWQMRLAAAAMLAVGTSLARGDDATTQPTSRPTPEVLALVGDLDSDQFSVRESAEKKLIDMGDAVEPQLQEISKGNLSEEARTRVFAAMHGIDENRQTNTTFITMHRDNAPMLDVLNDFAAQAHADLGFGDPMLVDYCRIRRVSIDLDHANFWDALRELSDQTNLRPASNNNIATMRLTTSPMNGVPPWFRGGGEDHGPFLIVPISCSRNQSASVRFGQPAVAAQSNLSLQLNVVAEPKLHLTTIDVSDWLKECTDDKGRSLLPSQKVNYGMAMNQQGWWPLQTSLQDYPDAGAKIAVPKGQIHCSVQVKSESIDVDDLSKPMNLTRTINGITITVTGPVQQNNQWQLNFNATGDLGNNPWQTINMMTSNVEITDDQGRAFNHGGGGGGGSNRQQSLTMMLMPPNPPGSVPKKLHWEVPTEVRQITVPFELHDLALPPLH